MKQLIISLLSLILLSYSSNAAELHKKGRGNWYNETNSYVDLPRNLQWQLSNVINWRIAEDYRLPENALFCAVADQLGIVVMALAMQFPLDQQFDSIWNASDDFIAGMKSSLKAQAQTLPGISYREPKLDKTYFLYKEAFKVTLISDITDARLLDDQSVPFAFQMYAFVLDDEFIEVTAMVPQWIIDESGPEVFDVLLNGVGYIDASREAAK